MKRPNYLMMRQNASVRCARASSATLTALTVLTVLTTNVNIDKLGPSDNRILLIGHALPIAGLEGRVEAKLLYASIRGSY